MNPHEANSVQVLLILLNFQLWYGTILSLVDQLSIQTQYMCFIDSSSYTYFLHDDTFQDIVYLFSLGIRWEKRLSRVYTES